MQREDSLALQGVYYTWHKAPAGIYTHTVNKKLSGLVCHLRAFTWHGAAYFRNPFHYCALLPD